MEWHEDPVRAREALRSAAWRGAWSALGMLAVVLLFAAILFPVFAQSKGGPKLNARWVASVIQAARRDTEKWPVAFDEVASRFTADDHLGLHHVSFVKIADRGHEAEYAIAFDHSLKVFKLDSEITLMEVGKPAVGTLPKGGRG